MEHMETQEMETNETPLDGLIERVKSYIEEPKLVTKETLQELLSELEDLKSVMDEEEPEEEMPKEKEGKNPGLLISIGSIMKKAHKGKEKEYA